MVIIYVYAQYIYKNVIWRIEMILEFTVKNFLSIKDEVTLSMVASKDSSFEDNLLPYEDGKKIKKCFKISCYIWC